MGCLHNLLFRVMICFSYLGLISCGEASLAPALYVFGDSLFDSGNNNNLPTLARANFSPYGCNFSDGVTGRFTNGRTIPDFIAEFLKLPYALPYSLASAANVSTGFNYASGACGILPRTGKIAGKCYNFDEQVELFNKTIKTTLQNQFANSSQLYEYLSKSIFIITMGSNDYLDTHLKPTSTKYTPESFAQILVDLVTKQLERMYHLGARKIIMSEVGPIGCLPFIKKMHNRTGECYEVKNKYISLFNEKLPPMLKNLTSTLEGSIFVLAKIYQPAYDGIHNPSLYDVKDASNTCCVTWLNLKSLCIPLRKPCEDSNTHFFFDGFHLTEKVNSKITNQLIDGDETHATPVNLKKLVQM